MEAPSNTTTNKYPPIKSIHVGQRGKDTVYTATRRAKNLSLMPSTARYGNLVNPVTRLDPSTPGGKISLIRRGRADTAVSKSLNQKSGSLHKH